MMFGNAGQDDFVYRSVGESGLGSNSDRIMDLVVGEDQIDLTAFGIDPQDLAIGGTFTGTGASARTVQTATDTLVFVDADGDGVSDMRIVVVGTLGLIGTEFILKGDFPFA